MITPSVLTQTANYIQSNDLVYRTALDIFGFNIPFYKMGRNKDEKREIFIGEIVIATMMGFILAPFNVAILNKIAGKTYLNNNTAFFRLHWKHTDPLKQEEAIKFLEKEVERLHHRLQAPNNFDKLPFMVKNLQKSRSKIQEAIKTFHHDPATLQKVYKAKRTVLLADLLLTGLALASIGPIKNWSSRYFANKDRFTGTQNYLSDEDLKKLVGKDKKHTQLQRSIYQILIVAPALFAGIIHKNTRGKLVKGLTPHKNLLKLRDYMDYNNAIYMSLGTMLSVFLAKNLNIVNMARDKYERTELAIKYSLIMASFWYGDLFFNGNIARAVDKVITPQLNIPQGTFYIPEKSNVVIAHTRNVQDVIEKVAKTHDRQTITKAAKIASLIFYSGFTVHSLSAAGIIYLANKITRQRVTNDLKTLQQENIFNKLMTKPS